MWLTALRVGLARRLHRLARRLDPLPPATYRVDVRARFPDTPADYQAILERARELGRSPWRP
jgi:hypothetical protein